MKKLFIILFILVSVFANATTYYVSPTGSDGAAGSLAAPWQHLNYAINKLVAGDILYMRGGTYRSQYTNTTNTHINVKNIAGTSGSPILVEAYNDEVPIFNMDNIPVNNSYVYKHGIVLSGCAYLTIKDLTITNIYQSTTGAPAWGWGIEDSHHILLENCTVSYVQGYGFTCDPGNYEITYINCDAHHCIDYYADPHGSNSSYENANGFGVTGGDGTQWEINNSYNITYDGCRAWKNADDGWDFFGANGFITIKNCWAFWNGYNDSFGALGDGNGFKLGPLISNFFSSDKRYIFNNISARNSSVGFSENFNSSLGTCIFHVYNNIAYLNGTIGFGFNTDFLPTGPAHILRNNVSYANTNPWTGGGSYAGTIHDHNTWDASVTVTNADFVGLDVNKMDDERQANGDLPLLSFLHLASGSDLIDAGIDVGLPYNGSAPDLGAFESSGTTGIELTGNNSKIKVYPNPVTDELIIEIEGNNDRQGFEILNSIGQIVFKGNLSERTVVETTNFPPGIYLMKIKNSRSFELMKIVKV